jgi:hypothetical protein
MPIMIFMTRYYHNSRLTRRLSSVSHSINKIIRLATFASLVFFVTSCLEDPTKIGNSLLPGSDFVAIKSIDTLSARSYTMVTDSVRTDNPSSSFLGYLFDDYFGTTTAEFVSQVRLSKAWDDQPFVVDSVKLFLHLLDVKGGGAGIPHRIKISEIADEIYTDHPYYSNTPVNLTGFEVADIELPQLKADTINNIGVMLPGNGIEFGNYILRDTTQLFYSNTQPDFRAFFKGLLFQMEPDADPLLISLSVAPNSLGYYSNYFAIFYHDPDGLAKQYFLILDATNKNAAFNRFSFNFSTATADLKINHINDGYRDTLSYVQALNGAFTKISIPGLASLKSDAYFKNIAVNRARLTVPAFFDGIHYVISTAPSPIYIRYETTQGNKYLVPDFNLDSYHSFYDGTLDTLNYVYNFNLAAFVQKYFSDTADTIKPEFELFLGGGTKNSILKANNSKTPVKFEFTYTKF